MYGVTRHWHKRIVRAEPNTLSPYDENSPDLTVAEDDIVFLDFGPIFAEWEADFGRTYVVGTDPLKHKLCRDIEEAFVKGKRHFQERPDITGAEILRICAGTSERSGLGIWWTNRWTSDRRIPPREDCRRQGHSLCPS